MLRGIPCICIFSLCLIRNHNKGTVSVIWSDPAKYSYWLVLINVCNRGDSGDVIASYLIQLIIIIHYGTPFIQKCVERI